MTDALENHQGTVSTGGRKITNLHFADDIDGLASMEELENLVKTLETTSTAYGIETSSEKKKQRSSQIKLMAAQKYFKVKDCNLETVINFNYLGAFVTDEGSKKKKKRNASKNSASNIGADEAKDSVEGQEHHLQTQDPNTSFNSRINLTLRM